MKNLPPVRLSCALRLFLFVATTALLAPLAPADVVTGADWTVCFNLPSQTTNAPAEGEYDIRDLLVSQFNRLQEGQRAAISTFTLSGNSLATGMAAPLLAAISQALDRGAAVHFVINSGIIPWQKFGKISLQRLARRRDNPMVLSISPTNSLMHNKAALFDFGDDQQWTVLCSGNFTTAANRRQWNISVLLRNPGLHAALSREMDEFRAGRFRLDKQCDHDRSLFRLEESWGDCWVRFGPCSARPGGDPTAEMDVIRIINEAEHEIFFAMHRFSRAPIARALVAAANRGVRVTGVIPESDRRRSMPAVSLHIVKYFAATNDYTTTNRVVLAPARNNAFMPGWDSGEEDLVHCKYLIADPDGERPVVVHGVANWTRMGISSPKGNDETILFLCHRGIAQAFLQHFRRMTSAP